DGQAVAVREPHGHRLARRRHADALQRVLDRGGSDVEEGIAELGSGRRQCAQGAADRYRQCCDSSVHAIPPGKPSVIRFEDRRARVAIAAAAASNTSSMPVAPLPPPPAAGRAATCTVRVAGWATLPARSLAVYVTV